MAKQISVEKLNRQLRYQGPYLYFYDGKCGGKNAEMVAYINFMANKYKKLKVFQINWEDKKRYVPSTPLEERDKIYLYYLGMERERMYLPDTQNIKEFFNKAIEFFNFNIERKAQNIGTRPRDKCKDDKNQNPAKSKRSCHERENYIAYKKKYIRNQKIKIINEYQKAERLQKNHVLLKITTLPQEKIILAGKNLTDQKSIKNVQKLEQNEIPSSKKWFDDINITNLPMEIFSDECPIKTDIINQIFVTDSKITAKRAESPRKFKINNDFTLVNQCIKKTSLSLKEEHNILQELRRF